MATFVSSWVVIIASLLAIFSYAFFSRHYEQLTRDTSNPLYAATILYGVAAGILAVLTLSSTFLGFLLTKKVIWGWQINVTSPITIFNVPIDGSFALLLVFLLLVSGMSLFYATHIATEAASRRSINMGAYTLIFQLNVLVIAFFDWAIYRVQPGGVVLVGGILLFASSLGTIFIHQKERKPLIKIHEKHKIRRKVPKPDKFEKFRFTLGVVSAIACGSALYIDGEIGRNYILKGSISLLNISNFIFYEMLTFGIPALWTLLLLCFRSRIVDVIRSIKEEFLAHSFAYFLSSLFSVGQFVFSVLALSLPGPRFVVAMILSASPALTIALDKSYRSVKRFERTDFVMALLGALGFLLLWR